ncbi:MAG: FtsX-like permease family protein [Bacteroidales bacterium]
MNPELLKIAWRNLWRNRRRSLITLASIYFSVFFAVTMRGYHLGMWKNLLDGVLHSYTGYLQIHATGYWENKTLDYTFSWDDSLNRSILANKDINGLIPRLESFGLASSGEKTKAVLVAGIQPELEIPFTRLDEKIRKGRLIDTDDPGVVLSERLSVFLGLKPGDTLTLISQGYQGVSAQGLYPVRGIVKLPAPEWDNMMVYMTLENAQIFYSAEGQISSLVVDIPPDSKIEKLARHLRTELNQQQYEVMSWKEMLVELFQQWQADNAGMILILALLYLIIGFGIFGTVMMMINERQREFGIMVAVGMKPAKLSFVVSTEMILLSSLGVFAGMISSIPLVYFLYLHPFNITGETAKVFAQYGMEPVIQVRWHWKYILNQGLAVYLVTLLAAIYPVYSIIRIKLIKALRGI